MKTANPSEQLEYRFKTDRSGRFSIALHGARQNNLVKDFEPDRGNDVFVSIVNAKTGKSVVPATKFPTFFKSSNLTYKWGSTFSRNAVLTPAVANLQGGTEYRLLLSGRSRGYAVDRITLSDDRVFRNLSAPQSRRVPAGGGNGGGGNGGGGNGGGGNARPTAKFIPRQRSTDGSRVNLDLSRFFSDRDGNIASYSAKGLPKGLSINKNGIISGKLSSTASRGDGTNDGSRTYEVNVRATDNDDASVNKSFRYTVNSVQRPSPQPKRGPSFRIEAESLQLKRYRVESNSFASKGKLISLRGGKSGETGSATYVHRRQAGTFDIDLRYFDENDGVSTMTVKLNGKQIDRWRLDARTNGTNVSGGTSRIRKLRGLTLKAGDRLEIVGAERQREHARLDYLSFKPVASK